MSSGATAEREYFTQLFEQHHRALYAYVYKKTKDSFVAEEIAQTSFIKFWQHRLRTNTLQQETPEKLLFFIAKALLVDHYRKKTTTISIEDALATNGDIPDDSHAQQHESLQFSSLVRSVAGSLPDRQKLIFEMSYFGSLTHEQIATELNISRQTVKNLLGKALKQVRKLAARQFLSTFTGLL